MGAFWSQRNPRERTMIVVCVLAAVVGIPMMLQPVSGRSGKLVPLAEAKRKYDTAVKQKSAIEDDTAKLRPLLAKLTYDAPPETLIPKVIRDLQAQAKQCGIHLREVKPMRARRTGSLTKVPINVRFSAPFVQSIPLLYRIEDPSGKLTAEKVAVITPDPKSRIVDVELQIALYTTGTSAGPES